MGAPWPRLDDVCTELGFVRDDDGIWHGEYAGVTVTTEYVAARWGLVRFHARIDPPLGIDMQLGREVSAPAESLEDMAFRIVANDPQRAQAILADAADVILAATHNHHWVCVLDKWVMLSAYARGSRQTLPYIRDTPERIRESLDRVTDVARCISATSKSLGPVELREPPSAPRPVRGKLTRDLKVAAFVLGLIGSFGVVIGALVGTAEPIVTMIAFGWAALWWIPTSWCVFTAWRRSSLYRGGRPVLGTVTSTRVLNRWDYGHRVWEYAFTLDEPAGVTGTHKTVNPPDVGDRLWAICDPANPSRSIPAVL